MQNNDDKLDWGINPSMDDYNKLARLTVKKMYPNLSDEELDEMGRHAEEAYWREWSNRWNLVE